MQATRAAAAAAARRAAADQAGERGGEQAYRQFRLAVPGVGSARRVGMKTELRAEPEKRNGKDMVHTSGYFTAYDRCYPMWDDFGPYDEVTRRGSGATTLATDPDVCFLINHKGLALARTRGTKATTRTLELREDSAGGFHDAWLNPERSDIRDLVTGINDGVITEMSFAFMIPDGAGEWSDDFSTFAITAYDIDRGDVSAVNYGANPYTDISASSLEVFRELERLPRGARAEAASRLAATSGVTVIDLGTRVNRSGLTWRSDRAKVSMTAARSTRALNWRMSHTTARMVAYAQEHNLAPHEMAMAALPWFEVRNAAGTADGQSATDVLIYDEIGGSFGTNAADFAEAIAEIDTDVINLRINSPGGSVRDALGIHSSLLHHPAFVHTFIDGIAASAATVVALAGDQITVMPGGQMMVHDAAILADGNAAELAKMVTFLERQSDNIASMYAGKAGGTVEEWRAIMQAETWMYGQEAVDMGLATDVWQGGRVSADVEDPREERMTRSFDLSHFRYCGRAAAPAPQRRAHIGDHPSVRPVLDDVTEMVEDVFAQAASPAEDPEFTQDAPVEVTQRSRSTSEDRPRGRSIAYVEALLEAEWGADIKY